MKNFILAMFGVRKEIPTFASIQAKASVLHTETKELVEEIEDYLILQRVTLANIDMSNPDSLEQRELIIESIRLGEETLRSAQGTVRKSAKLAGIH